MSKSTKIIAGLGVAAALGVAALPAATFAANYGTHEVEVSAIVEGSITASIATGANASDPADWATSGEIDFGNLSTGDMLVHANTTRMVVETNYPNGYEFTAVAAALPNTTAGSGTIALTNGTVITGDSTTKGSYSGDTSVWGIRVSKATWNGSAWGTSTVMSTGDYASTTNNEYKSLASGTIDEVGPLAATTKNKYDINYGIAIAGDQASGTYENSTAIVYTLAADDYNTQP